MTSEYHAEELRKAGFGDCEKPLDFQRIQPEILGQREPHHYPHPEDALGEPLTIKEAAKLLGCSPWTVRHSHMPKGLPHLRSGRLGKLIFYHNQVVHWIIQRQRKGGM